MTELITITQKALQSQSWKIKAQGAAAMATVAREQTGSLVAPHLGLVLTALLNGLAGRTWAGKVRGLLLHAVWGGGEGRGLRLSCCPSPCAPVCVCLPGGAAQSHWVSGVQMQVGLTRAVREERTSERVRERIIGKHSPYGLTGEWSLLLLWKCSHWISLECGVYSCSRRVAQCRFYVKDHSDNVVPGCLDVDLGYASSLNLPFLFLSFFLSFFPPPPSAGSCRSRAPASPPSRRCWSWC